MNKIFKDIRTYFMIILIIVILWLGYQLIKYPILSTKYIIIFMIVNIVIMLLFILSQYKAKGQFCYSIDSNWKKRLNGNYTAAVKQAVLDALNGKRNHNYLSFRSARSYSGGVNIGGNAYFNPM